jgi:hypothetical protein
MSGPGPTRAGRTAALLAALLLVVSAVPPVTAHHAGRPIGSFSSCRRPNVSPPRCSSVGNDARHFVVFDATLTAGLAESLRDAMIEDYEPTKLEMILQDAVTPETDVIVFSQDYGNNGAAGWVNCPLHAPQGINRQRHRWCQQQELHFNLNPSLAIFFADDGSRDHVACHEIGHTLGLRHWGNPPESVGPPAETCMNADMPDGPTVLHQVDRDHIDAYRYSMLPPSQQQTPKDVPSDRDRRRLLSAWADTVVEAIELERYASLAQMTRGSDAVVVGRVASVAAGRVVGRAGSALQYAAVTVMVDEAVAGSLPGEHATQLTLEVPLFGGAEQLHELRSALPTAESLFFLRNKGAGEADFYRLVVMRGVVVNRDGAAEVTPGDGDFLDALDGIPFDEVVSGVRRSRP